jgi:signal transduction histidine kinase
MQSGPNKIIIFITIATILILALVGFTILILFLYQKKQVSFLQSVEALKLDHEKSLLKTQLEIQEQTFQNISREIHDNIGLSLTLAKLNLNVIDLEKTVGSEDLILSSIDLISKSINDLSDISKSLNSEAISQKGLLNALQLEMEKLKKLNKFNVEFEVTGNPVYFDSQKELILFRIAQEALNNIIKHSDARSIYMRVSFNENDIKLSIQDNGKGFYCNTNQNMLQGNMKAGLTNMQIRSKLINGDMKIVSEIGKGTTIVVSAPLEAK